MVLGLAAANILVCLVAAFALYQSKLLYEQAAEVLTQNIASAIELCPGHAESRSRLAVGG